MTNLKKLIDIMSALRGDKGCPWDKEQTRDSLKPFLLEETYEVLEALDEGDSEKIKEELGDPPISDSLSLPACKGKEWI